jgi:hypothetical protein
LRQFLNEHTQANEIRMLRSQFQGAFLIVEGSTDQRFYKRFIDPDQCMIRAASGKEMALKVMDILERDRFPGILAILDADSLIVEQAVPASPNILLTDDHDIEMVIIRSPALEKVLDEYASEAKIAQFKQQTGQDVRSALLERGLHLGYLRWHSLRANLALKFEDLDFTKFVKRDALSFSPAAMIRAIKDHSQKPGLNEHDILARLQELAALGHDPAQICCCHDAITLLALGLCKIWGSHNTGDLPPAALESILRIAFETAHFHATRLYAAICTWEQTNTPYVILAKGHPS